MIGDNFDELETLRDRDTQPAPADDVHAPSLPDLLARRLDAIDSSLKVIRLSLQLAISQWKTTGQQVALLHERVSALEDDGPLVVAEAGKSIL